MSLMFCDQCQNVMVPEKALKRNVKYICRVCRLEKNVKPIKMVLTEEVHAPTAEAILLREKPEFVF